MGNRRALLVIVAVVLAIAAGGLAFIVLNDAQDEAKSNFKVVYVAKAAIPQGTQIDASNQATYLTTGKVEVLSADAVTTPSQLTGLVAKVAIAPNTPLSTSLFGTKQQAFSVTTSGNDVASQLDADRDAVNETASKSATAEANKDANRPKDVSNNAACDVADAIAKQNQYELFVEDPFKAELSRSKCGQTGSPVQFKEKDGKTAVTVTVGKNLWKAVSFSVDQVKGVAGFVAPGDTINFILYKCTDGQKTCSPPDAAVGAPSLQNVLVLRTSAAAAAAPTTTVAGSGAPATPATPASSGLITVRVTPQQAAEIALAQSFGSSIYLTLNPTPAPPTTTTTAPAAKK